MLFSGDGMERLPSRVLYSLLSVLAAGVLAAVALHSKDPFSPIGIRLLADGKSALISLDLQNPFTMPTVQAFPLEDWGDRVSKDGQITDKQQRRKYEAYALGITEYVCHKAPASRRIDNRHQRRTKRGVCLAKTAKVV